MSILSTLRHSPQAACLQSALKKQGTPFFLTLCTKDKQPILGDLTLEGVHLTDFGRMSRAAFLETIRAYPCLQAESLQVFPRCAHIILRMHPFECSCWKESPVSPWADGAQEKLLEHFIRAFKRASNACVNAAKPGRRVQLWEGAHFHHRVRSAQDVASLRTSFQSPLLDPGWDYPEGNESL